MSERAPTAASLTRLTGDWLYDRRRLTELRRLDLFSRLYHPAFVLVVVLAYVARYRSTTFNL